MMNLLGAWCVESLDPLRLRKRSSKIAGQSASSRVFTGDILISIHIFEIIETKGIFSMITGDKKRDMYRVDWKDKLPFVCPTPNPSTTRVNAPTDLTMTVLDP